MRSDGSSPSTRTRAARPTAVALLVAAALAGVAVEAQAAPTAEPAATCKSLRAGRNLQIVKIRASRVSCRTARGVLKAWATEVSETARHPRKVKGWRFTPIDEAYGTWKVRRKKATIRFLFPGGLDR